MARKLPFHFNFDEDADPVEELHRLRVVTADHFKTLDAMMAYLRSSPSIQEQIEELDKTIAREKQKAVSATKKPSGKKAQGRKKNAKPVPHS